MRMAYELETAIARHVWETKYRYAEAGEQNIEASWRRVAGALARVEGERAAEWEARFYDLLRDFRFIPGGRILAGAGTARRVTLFNCFVMGVIDDSLDGIFDALKEGALTMQQGGGIGYDFSSLRPYGTRARSVGGIASGPVSFMRIWDAMCATLLSTGARRGAMMATLRCDHPDIERFVDAKRDARELRHFNLSVLVTDALIEAVRTDAPWPLVFPASRLETDAPGPVVERHWPGEAGPVACRVVRVVPARALWERLMRATYDCAEPGVLFIDRISRSNNLAYRERISATNPCGEIPLPPYGACNLGSINLTRFVRAAFTDRAELDLAGVAATAATAVRLLDNVIEASAFPLPSQAAEARGSRRLGLGFTGLGDALAMLGVRYGDPRSFQVAAGAMRSVCHAAYRASVALAREKAPFDYLDRERFLDAPFVRGLPEDIRDGIARHGIRNSHLTALAPTGTISLLAENVSSGIEPIFDYCYHRRVLQEDGGYAEHEVSDYAWRQWRRDHGPRPLPEAFVDARSLAPEEHLAMQAAVQPFVDNAISKTINVPADFPFERFQSIYQRAFDLGLKGCTTYRPNPVTGAILSPNQADGEVSHCCTVEREAD
jgi:ribonucleoside-diphosphate reductase alpha chain